MAIPTQPAQSLQRRSASFAVCQGWGILLLYATTGLLLPACSQKVADAPSSVLSSPSPVSILMGQGAKQGASESKTRKVKASDLIEDIQQAIGLIVLIRKQSTDEKALHSNQSRAFFKAIVETNTSLKGLKQSMSSRNRTFGQQVQKMAQAVEQVGVTYRYSDISNSKIQQGMEMLNQAWATFQEKYGQQAANKMKNQPLAKPQRNELAQLKTKNNQLVAQLTRLQKQVSRNPAMAQEASLMIQKAQQINTAPATTDGLIEALYLMSLLNGWYDGYYSYVEYVEPTYVEYFTPFDTYWQSVENVTVNINNWTYAEYNYESFDSQIEINQSTTNILNIENESVVNSVNLESENINSEMIGYEVNMLDQEVDSATFDSAETGAETGAETEAESPTSGMGVDDITSDESSFDNGSFVDASGSAELDPSDSDFSQSSGSDVSHSDTSQPESSDASGYDFSQPEPSDSNNSSAYDSSAYDSSEYDSPEPEPDSSNSSSADSYSSDQSDSYDSGSYDSDQSNSYDSGSYDSEVEN